MKAIVVAVLCIFLGALGAPMEAQIEQLVDLGGVWAARSTEVVERASACVADDTTLCLHDGRFSVQFTLDWGSSKELAGHVIQSPSDEYGGFWVYGPDNPEMTLKVLDGCAINGRYWVYAAGLTDRAFFLTVKDEHTGDITYYGKFPAYMVSWKDTGTNFPCESHH